MELAPFVSAHDFLRPPRPLVGVIGSSEMYHYLVSQVPQAQHVVAYIPLTPDYVRSSSSISSIGLEISWIYGLWESDPAAVVLTFTFNEDSDPWGSMESRIVAATSRYRERNSGVGAVVAIFCTNSVSPLLAQQTQHLWRRAGLRDRSRVVLLDSTSSEDTMTAFEGILFQTATEIYHEQIRALKRGALDQGEFDAALSIRIGMLYFACNDRDSGIRHIYLAFQRLSRFHTVEAKNLAYLATFLLIGSRVRSGEFNEAVSQFTEHLEIFDVFRAEMCPFEFQHVAWLEHQYTVFGNILETVPSPLCFADPLHHPLYYFDRTSQLARARKALVTAAQSYYPIDQIRTAFVTQFMVPSRYYGRIELGADGMGEVAVTAGVTRADLAIVSEGDINHSERVLEAMRKAYKVARKRNYKRRALLIKREMGLEYFSAGEFGLSLKLFQNLLETYREENCIALLRDILHKVLVCTRELGHPLEFTMCAFEMMGPRMLTSPQLGVSLYSECLHQLSTLDDFEFIYSSRSNMLDVRVMFASNMIHIGEVFEVAVEIISNASVSFVVDSIHFITTGGLCDFVIQLGNDFVLKPGIQYQFHFSGECHSDIGYSHITICEVALVFPSGTKLKYGVPTPRGYRSFLDIVASEPIYILEELTYPCSLVQNFTLHTYIISCPSEVPGTSLNLKVAWSCSVEEACTVYVKNDDGSFVAISSIDASFDVIADSGCTVQVDIYLCTQTSSLVSLTAKLQDGIFFVQELYTCLNFIDPFISYSENTGLRTDSHSDHQLIQLESSIVNHIDIINNSESLIYIHGIQPVLNGCLDFSPPPFSVWELCPFDFGAQERFSDCFPCKAERVFSHSSMGYIEVFWSLESQPDYLNTFHIELPYIEVEGPRIRIELNTPAQCVAGHLFNVLIFLTSLLKDDDTIDFSVAPSIPFDVHGTPSASIRLHPNTPTTLSFDLVCLSSGSFPFPDIKLHSSYLQRNVFVQTELYVFAAPS